MGLSLIHISGATLTFEEDPAKAAQGADVLYTDVWVLSLIHIFTVIADHDSDKDTVNSADRKVAARLKIALPVKAAGVYLLSLIHIYYTKLDTLTIGVCGGDGIGPIITEASQRVLEYLLADEVKAGKMKFKVIDGLTIENRAACNKAIPDDVMDELYKCKMCIRDRAMPAWRRPTRR